MLFTNPVNFSQKTYPKVESLGCFYPVYFFAPTQYDILVGTTADGCLMTDEEYHKFINLPVKEFIAEEKRNPYWLKTTGG